MTETKRDKIAGPDHRRLHARSFASQIIHALDEFLPTHGGVRQRIHSQLMEDAYKVNAMIVNVPPEFDHLSEAAAEREIIDRMMKPFVLPLIPHAYNAGEKDG